MKLITLHLAQSVEGTRLAICGSQDQSLAPVLLFTTLVEFYKCIMGANFIDFKICTTMVVIKI